MAVKTNPVKKAGRIPKQTVQNVRKKIVQNGKIKNKMKKMAKKFILDQQGDAQPATLSKSKQTTPQHALGQDPPLNNVMKRKKKIIKKNQQGQPAKLSNSKKTKPEDASGQDPSLQNVIKKKKKIIKKDQQGNTQPAILSKSKEARPEDTLGQDLPLQNGIKKKRKIIKRAQQGQPAKLSSSKKARPQHALGQDPSLQNVIKKKKKIIKKNQGGNTQPATLSKSKKTTPEDASGQNPSLQNVVKKKKKIIKKNQQDQPAKLSSFKKTTPQDALGQNSPLQNVNKRKRKIIVKDQQGDTQPAKLSKSKKVGSQSALGQNPPLQNGIKKKMKIIKKNQQGDTQPATLSKSKQTKPQGALGQNPPLQNVIKKKKKIIKKNQKGNTQPAKLSNSKKTKPEDASGQNSSLQNVIKKKKKIIKKKQQGQPAKLPSFKTKAQDALGHKLPLQNMKKRKNLIKKKPEKFILDQQGENRPANLSNSKKTRPEGALGHNLPRQNVIKKKTKIRKKPKKFILDQQGSTQPAKLFNPQRPRPENILGHNPLLQKERDLVADLFGDDGSLEDQPETPMEEEQEEDRCEVMLKTETRVNGEAAIIPHDPFDIHQQDEEERRPAWIDEDDHSIRVKDVVAGMDRMRGSRGVREESEEQYSQTLKQKYNQTLGGTPDWARLHQPDAEQDMEDGGLVRSTSNYLAHGKSVKLNKKRIEFKKQVDVNHDSRTEGAVISAAEFNPKHQVAMVAGFTSTVVGAVSFFKVDGTYNHLINSVKFPKYPIKFGKFLCDGGSVVAGSNQYNCFYSYDLEAAQETRIPYNLGRDGQGMKNVFVSPDEETLVFVGKNGHLQLFDADCLSHVETLHTPGEVTDAAFNSSGSRMYTHTTEGNVFVWDMNARTCIHRFYDDGCIGGTSIAVSPNNQYLACGSSSGIVNMYDLANVMQPSPVPVKMLTRLRTSVSTLLFNSSSEILASTSDQMDNGIKLVHLPSMTYFENFPDPRSELRRINVLNFSPQSGYLTAGNKSGRAFLYRLHHFTDY